MSRCRGGIVRSVFLARVDSVLSLQSEDQFQFVARERTVMPHERKDEKTQTMRCVSHEPKDGSYDDPLWIKVGTREARRPSEKETKGRKERKKKKEK